MPKAAAAQRSDFYGPDASRTFASRNSYPAKCLVLTLAQYIVLDAEPRHTLLIEVDGSARRTKIALLSDVWPLVYQTSCLEASPIEPARSCVSPQSLQGQRARV
jgi:hypothetical protein